MTDVAVELDERARVEQLLDALARQQLPPLPLTCDGASRSRRAPPARRALAARRAWRRWCRASRPWPPSLIRSPGWSRRSTARPPGRTSTESRGRSTTRGTRTRSESRRSGVLGELEGGDALLFSSGMGAETALVLALLSPGSTDRARAGRLLRNRRSLPRARALGPPARSVRPDRATASGRRPRLDRGAVESAADDARLRGGGGASRSASSCDATAATPVHLRPLELGCDLVLHSATKYLAGHHDVLLGAVVCKSAEHAARLHELEDAHRDRRGARRRLAPRTRAEDARGPRQPSKPVGAGSSRSGWRSTRGSRK